MTPEIIQSKRRSRYLERVWPKSRSSLDRYATRRNVIYVSEMKKAKSYYYETMVASSSAAPKQLWKCFNQSLHRRPAPSFSTHASFIKSFKDRISLIHSAVTYHTSEIANADSPQLNYQLASFEPTTTAEVQQIIMSSPSKSCDH